MMKISKEKKTHHQKESSPHHQVNPSAWAVLPANLEVVLPARVDSQRLRLMKLIILISPFLTGANTLRVSWPLKNSWWTFHHKGHSAKSASFNWANGLMTSKRSNSLGLSLNTSSIPPSLSTTFSIQPSNSKFCKSSWEMVCAIQEIFDRFIAFYFCVFLFFFFLYDLLD